MGEKTPEVLKEGTQPSISTKSGIGKGIVISLGIVVIVLISICGFMTYSAGYFGTVGNATGTWKQQYEKMTESRDGWKDKFDDMEDEWELMTEDRDKWRSEYNLMKADRDTWSANYYSMKQDRDSWESKYWSEKQKYAGQIPNMKVTNSQIYETTRGFFTVHHDLNVKCDVVNHGGTGGATVTLVIKDRPTGSTLASRSQNVNVMKGATETVAWQFEDMLNNRDINQLDVTLTLTNQWME